MFSIKFEKNHKDKMHSHSKLSGMFFFMSLLGHHNMNSKEFVAKAL